MFEVYIKNVKDLYDDKTFAVEFEKVHEDRKKKILACKKPGEKVRSLGAGILLMEALRQYLGVEGTAVQSGKVSFSLDYGKDGKPFLKEYPDIFFNLSHSGDYVVCVLANKEVGIDIQEIKDIERTIAKRFFTIQEQGLIQAESTEEGKKQRFFQLWAAKESYLKFTGKGMRLPLDSFTADIENGEIWSFVNNEKKVESYLYMIEMNEHYKCCVCIGEKGIPSWREFTLS